MCHAWAEYDQTAWNHVSVDDLNDMWWRYCALLVRDTHVIWARSSSLLVDPDPKRFAPVPDHDLGRANTRIALFVIMSDLVLLAGQNRLGNLHSRRTISRPPTDVDA